MNQNQLRDLINKLDRQWECDELPVEMPQDERDILEKVQDYDLFLKKTDASYYPIHEAAKGTSEAFNIEVIQKIKRMPKLLEYYESLATSKRSLESLKNILDALETKFEPVPRDKLSFMLLLQGRHMLVAPHDDFSEQTLNLISWLQSKGADINYTGARNGSESVLMLQSGVGYAETVRKLLQIGADPNMQLSSGGTALLFCAGKVFPTKDFLHLNYQERLKSMRLLLEAGAKIVTGPKRSDDARYFAGRNTEKEYEGSEEFKTAAVALLQQFSDS